MRRKKKVLWVACPPLQLQNIALANWKECRRCIKLFIVQHCNFHFGTECVYILQYTQYTWLIFSPLRGAVLCACASSSTHGHAASPRPTHPVFILPYITQISSSPDRRSDAGAGPAQLLSFRACRAGTTRLGLAPRMPGESGRKTRRTASKAHFSRYLMLILIGFFLPDVLWKISL